MRGKKKGYRIQDTRYRNRASCIVHRVSCIRSHHASRITRHAGFTLVELLITMAVFVFVIAAATSLFVPLLTQFKQQSKMAETNIEGVVGLDIMRRDIEHAGYGLPWGVTGVADSDGDGNLWDELTNYLEASNTTTVCGSVDPSTYNDAASNAPKAIVSGNGSCTNPSGADYLVIKSANVARNYAAGKYTTLSTGNVKRTWVPDRENVNKDDSGTTNNNVRIIIISPGSTTANSRALVVASGAFFTTYSNTSAFAPSDNTDTRLIYGIDPDTDLTMPFNRADYYIETPTSNMPSRCASGTGVLYKATVNQSDGEPTELPLLDCVTDMQVTYCRDTNGDGVLDLNYDDISGLTAQEIREQVKEVRVYIVAHEGQRDATYDFSMGGTRNSLSAIEACGTNSRTITLPNLATVGDYKYYRWKVYTIVVKPIDLGQ